MDKHERVVKRREAGSADRAEATAHQFAEADVDWDWTVFWVDDVLALCAERDKLRELVERVRKAAGHQGLRPYERWELICKILDAKGGGP